MNARTVRIAAGLLAAGLVLLIAACAGLYGYGATLPVGHTASGATTLPAPPEVVWDLIADPTRAPEWRPEVASVELLGEGRWRERGGEPLTFELREAKPPARYVVAVVDHPDFGGTWTWVLAPTAGGTRLQIAEDGEVYSPLFRAIQRLITTPDATLQGQLRALERYFERGSP